jgi:hypothetical protein
MGYDPVLFYFELLLPLTYMLLQCVALLISLLGLRRIYKKRYLPDPADLSLLPIPLAFFVNATLLWLYYFLAWGPAPITLIVPHLLLFITSVATTLAYTLLLSANLLNYWRPKTWPKALDFLYLSLAFFALVRLANATQSPSDRLDDLDRAGLVLLALAFGVRLSKTIVEVFFDDIVNTPQRQALLTKWQFIKALLKFIPFTIAMGIVIGGTALLLSWVFNWNYTAN